MKLVAVWIEWFIAVLFFLFNLGATAADALSIGYRTVLIDDCCRGVDLLDIEETKNKLISNHGVIVSSNQVFIFLYSIFKKKLCNFVWLM